MRRHHRFRSLRVAGVEHGDRVGLFGFGASPHLAIAVLRSWNCEVYVSTRGEPHRHVATSLGAVWVGSEKEKILSRSALRGASFTSARQLRDAIDAFVKVYNEKATPFEWTKAVVHPHNSPKRLYSDLCK